MKEDARERVHAALVSRVETQIWTSTEEHQAES